MSSVIVPHELLIGPQCRSYPDIFYLHFAFQFELLIHLLCEFLQRFCCLCFDCLWFPALEINIHRQFLLFFFVFLFLFPELCVLLFYSIEQCLWYFLFRYMRHIPFFHFHSFPPTRYILLSVSCEGRNTWKRKEKTQPKQKGMRKII